MCVVENKGINVHWVSSTDWNSRIIMVVVKGNQNMNYVNDNHEFTCWDGLIYTSNCNIVVEVNEVFLKSLKHALVILTCRVWSNGMGKMSHGWIKVTKNTMSWTWKGTTTSFIMIYFVINCMGSIKMEKNMGLPKRSFENSWFWPNYESFNFAGS